MDSPFGALFITIVTGVFAYRVFIQFLKSPPSAEAPGLPPAGILTLLAFFIADVNCLSTVLLLTTLGALHAGIFRWECLAQKGSWIVVDPSCLGDYLPFALFLAALVGVMSFMFCFVLGQRRLAREKD